MNLGDVIHPSDRIKGRVRAYNVTDVFGFGGPLHGPRGVIPRNQRWNPTTDWQKNDVVYEWGAIVGRCLTLGTLNYRIAGLYLEFENTASPGDPVTVPTLDRTRDIEYYNNLSGSAVRDYLRVPLTAHTFGTSDVDLFPKGNQPVFFARTQGVEGVHGKAFANANNSTVFGGSLVAFVDNGDPTQDLIFSSFYFEVAEQQPKLTTSQVGIEWELTLE